MTRGTAFPRLERVLAVIAHPDDESFGLGALPDAFVRGGAEVSVLCFAHGEASTLHGRPGDLADVRATEAALDAAATPGIPVLGWAVPEPVTTRLHTAFAGRRADEIDWTMPVDRRRQRKAIAAHASQSTDNPVLRRRLRLLGDTEYLRRLG